MAEFCQSTPLPTFERYSSPCKETYVPPEKDYLYNNTNEACIGCAKHLMHRLQSQQYSN